MELRGLLIGAALAVSAAGPALAQGAAQAAAKPAPDNVSVWTLQGENDSVGAIGKRANNDKYYSNGIRVGWTSSPALVPETMKGLAQTLWGAGETRMSIDVTHQIYTPSATRLRNPPLGDRPYAGVLMGHLGLVQDGKTQTGLDTRSTMVLGLGLVGPAAGGQGLQNGFHEMIGQRTVLGWSTQLKNEPLIQITSERTWRLPIASFGGLETDALPSLTAAVGNLRVYLQTGAILRIGQGLQADFGPAAPRPAISGGDYFRNLRPLAWYIFLGADGRAVARDLTLEGNTFQSSRSVKKLPFVGEMQGGLAVIFHGVRLSYTHRVTTQEFRHQRGGLQQVGSVALSVRF
jgi:lipid A 3-O-deacylase